jgi:hypothetical protein
VRASFMLRSRERSIVVARQAHSRSPPAPLPLLAPNETHREGPCFHVGAGERRPVGPPRRRERIIPTRGAPSRHALFARVRLMTTVKLTRSCAAVGPAKETIGHSSMWRDTRPHFGEYVKLLVAIRHAAA